MSRPAKRVATENLVEASPKALSSRFEIGGVPVSLTCLGTMTMMKQCGEAEAHAQLDAYVARGGNFIDTAELYPVPNLVETHGMTEECIGRWLATKPADFRSKIVIATKVTGPHSARGGLLKREATLGGPPVDPKAEQRITADQIERAIEASLVRLQTSYVDLYQIHWPDRPVPLWGASRYTHRMALGHDHGMREKDHKPEPEGIVGDEHFRSVVEKMASLVKRGLIKAWGLSNETPAGMVRWCETAKALKAPLPLTLQQDFSLVDRRYETGGLAEACFMYGVKLLAYGPLAGGTLTGKYHDEKQKGALAGARHKLYPNFQGRYHAPRTMEATGKYIKLAESKKMTPTQLALGWTASRWYMGSVIIGANTVQQMLECLEAVEHSAVKSEDETCEKIDEIYTEYPDTNVTL